MRRSTNQRTVSIALVLLIGIGASAAMGSELVVSNVQVEQREFTAILDVTYDLQTVDGQAAMVWLLLSTDGGETFPHQCRAVSGDVGTGVMPGAGLHIVWDMAADFPGLVDANCQVRVMADDSDFMGDFVYLSPGSFTMGSPSYEFGHQDDETMHEVTLTQVFFISKHEVTEELWDAVMGDGSSTSQLPMGGVSWDMAVAFCNELSVLEGLTPAYTINGADGDVTWDRHADGYRLPTEAEWEYASRAGSDVAFTNGPISHPDCSPVDQNLDQVGWYCGNANGERRDVGLKQANDWGLHDMHGNVSEWVWDGYRADYGNLPHLNPVHEVAGSVPRIVRGGHFDEYAIHCRSAYRDSQEPASESGQVGLRLARTAVNLQVGTIVIETSPEDFEASWDLEGPGSLGASGIGRTVLAYMPAGEYTVTWGTVPGWGTPENQTLSLEQSGSVFFLGIYEPQTPDDGFVYIPPGTYTMGSPTDEPGRSSNRETQHPVTLTQGFYISRYEVTEEWWAEVMGEPSTTSQLPKGGVSWDMAVWFCNALSVQEGLTPAYTINGPNGNATWNQEAYRLPTEAEWEYACRAGSTTAFSNGPLTGSIECYPIDPNLDAMGWYCGNASDRQNVGQKQANAWGLYDMHGNVWELVWDGFRFDYENLPQENPVHDVGPGAVRVIRGGDWNNYARVCRSAYRYVSNPVYDYNSIGFRLVRSAP